MSDLFLGMEGVIFKWLIYSVYVLCMLIGNPHQTFLIFYLQNFIKFS